MKILAIIQGTAADLVDSLDPANYCITPVKDSKLFDDIIIASPKGDSGKILKDITSKWGIKIYFGSVYNVADRFYKVSKDLKADIIVRIQLRAFYVDMDLVKRLIEKLGNNYDYVDMDLDTNYSVGADVFTISSLERVLQYIKKLPEGHEKNVYKFSPWALLNNEKLFKIGKITYREMWDKERVQRIKSKLDLLLAREENKQAVDVSDPGSRYTYVHRFLSPEDTVLDIACGKGGGTAGLAEICKEVYGVDYNKIYIDEAADNYKKSNLHFLYGTEEILHSLGKKFDKIVCSHTLEHVDDDRKFLESLFEVLDIKGRLILEVPRLLKYPLGEPLWPFHTVEYEFGELKKLLHETGFEIEVEKGGNRNLYVDVKDAREVLFFVCKKKQ